MRTLALTILLSTACWPEGAFGTWKMNPARSTFIGDPHPKSLMARFEPHDRGEVFTVDKVGWDGRATTSSMILYLDGKSRNYQGFGCMGTQLSRRLDRRTIEVLIDCDDGPRTRFIRRQLSERTDEMILDITRKWPDGKQFDRHLILEKQ